MGNTYCSLAYRTSASEAFLFAQDKLKDYEKNYDIKMDEEHLIGGGAFG
jgi:hypothetical protein